MNLSPPTSRGISRYLAGLIVVLSWHVRLAWAYFRMPCMGVAGIGQVDPIMSPGKPSAHVHTIKGGSNFGETISVESMLASKCTTCQIREDKSAYWTPQLYFKHANGMFELVPEVAGHLSYYRWTPLYLHNGSLLNPVAIPNGFRMISGDSTRRNFSLPVPDPGGPWTGGDATQDALQQKALGFNCLHYNRPPNEPTTFRHTMPDKGFLDSNCEDGLRLEIAFPPCWNGRDLDSADHKSHVAFSDAGINGGKCPPGFDTPIMQLLFETIYPTQNYRGKDGQFVLSNGDPVGTGYHGDVFIAWEGEGGMAPAIAACGSAFTGPSLNGDVDACPAITHASPEEQAACKLEQTPPLAQGLLPQLPGNNPLQTGPQPALPPSPPAAAKGATGAGSGAPAAPAAPAPAPAAANAPAAVALLAANAGGAPASGPPSASNASPAPNPSPTPAPAAPPAAPPGAPPAAGTTTSYYTSAGTVHALVIIDVATTTTVPGAAASAPPPAPGAAGSDSAGAAAAGAAAADPAAGPANVHRRDGAHAFLQRRARLGSGRHRLHL